MNGKCEVMGGMTLSEAGLILDFFGVLMVGLDILGADNVKKVDKYFKDISQLPPLKGVA
jgi:hypothetical protein